MSKHNNVNPDHYKVAGRERQGEEVVHEIERREAKRARQGESRQHPAAGISNRMSADEEARDAAAHPPVDASDPQPEDAAGRLEDQTGEHSRDQQTSRKAGSRSMAQKEAGTRYPDRPMPASSKVEGAFGREKPSDE